MSPARTQVHLSPLDRLARRPDGHRPTASPGGGKSTTRFLKMPDIMTEHFLTQVRSRRDA